MMPIIGSTIPPSTLAIFIAMWAGTIFLIARDVRFVKAGGAPPSRRELILAIAFAVFWLGALVTAGIIRIIPPLESMSAATASALWFAVTWTIARYYGRRSRPMAALSALFGGTRRSHEK